MLLALLPSVADAYRDGGWVSDQRLRVGGLATLGEIRADAMSDLLDGVSVAPLHTGHGKGSPSGAGVDPESPPYPAFC